VEYTRASTSSHGVLGKGREGKGREGKGRGKGKGKGKGMGGGWTGKESQESRISKEKKTKIGGRGSGEDE
jgi:hypothetical protein